MHLVIFGLTISSSWGNGHATLWRSLVKAMICRGHTVSFYEHDVPYYAEARDLTVLPQGGKLRFYTSLEEIRGEVMRDLGDADLALCTSFCPDGAAACELILESNAAIKAFYDLDTPVTLAGLKDGGAIAYMPSRGLGDFDLVLSYTGGRALDELKSRLGARVVAPLYGSVDPENHRPVLAREEFCATLSYLGTYAEDRQQALEQLFLKPAARLPEEAFLIGGALYPQNKCWPENIALVQHVPPPDHPTFFCSGRATLNVTRRVMKEYGYCPSGRLFEATACGAPLLSDQWEGLGSFFSLGTEILPVSSADEVINALSLSDKKLRVIADAARERTLAEHTGISRVKELENICERVRGHASDGMCV
jgi:spore maturation protein CgeB